MRRALIQAGEHEEANRLKSFTCSFLKWRYNILSGVLHKLTEISMMCETLFTVKWFKKVKDETELQNVEKYCKDKCV